MPAHLHLELRSDPIRWRECNRVIIGARVFAFSQQKKLLLLASGRETAIKKKTSTANLSPL